MFPASSGTPQLLVVLLYAGCFLLSLPLDGAAAASAATPPISFSFDFSNPSLYDRDDLLLEGNATIGTNLVDLTCNKLELLDQTNRNCTGRMSYNHSVPFYRMGKATDEVASFSTLFTFKIVPAPPRRRGDGMAFFLAGYPSMIPPDSNGGGLGLIDRTATADGAQRFIAVEFDTYTFNQSWDQIAIGLSSVKKSENTTRATATLGGTMTASIDFNSSTRMLVARLHFDDDPSVQPVEVSTKLRDVTSLLPPEVAVGFSAATGANAELHQILSWSFNSTLAPPKKPISRGTWLSLAAIAVGICVFLLLAWFILSWFKWQRGRNSLMAGAGPRQYRYCDLAQATNNFSRERKLGEGAFGAVYMGKSFKVDSGQKQDVAIKEILKGSSEGRKDFLAELNIISKTKHKNLVRLEGWCCCSRSTWSFMCWCFLNQVDQKLFLVYELMPQGDLDHHLHKKDTVLPWPARYKIVKGIGSALVYLHHDCQPYILHRDIKPGNILLDDEYNAKLADFGISRIASKNNATLVTTAVGSIAYMDPRCRKDGDVKFNPSTDVYSFGLVLLEIACARRKSREQVWELYRTNGAPAFMVEDVADERLGGNFDREQIRRVLVVGLWCSLLDGSHRPSMQQALRLLEQEDSPLPDLASCANGATSS